jgi:hypothetical protein
MAVVVPGFMLPHVIAEVQIQPGTRTVSLPASGRPAAAPH